MTLICCKNCIYIDKEHDFDKPLYICLKRINKEISNRFIDFCIEFKKGVNNEN